MMIKTFKKIFIPCKENDYFPILLERRFLNFYFILIILLKIFTLPIIFFISQSPFFAEIVKSVLVEYLNAERVKNNLSPLSQNQKLAEAAYLKAKDILERDYFSHWSPDGKSPWYWFRLAGYDYQYAGENLAIGFLDSKEVHQAWMNSPSHRQNILNPHYKEVGIAVLKGDFNGVEVYVVVQHFGKSKESNLAKREKPTSTLVTSTPTPTSSLVSRETTTSSFSLPTSSVASEITSTPSDLTQTTTSLTQTTTSLTEIVSFQEVSVDKKENEKMPNSKEKISFVVAKLAVKKYNPTLNFVIYLSLFILLSSLLLTLYFDIFSYHKFVIDYKELFPRIVTFSLVLFLFLYLDQTKIIQIIPHEIFIYGH